MDGEELGLREEWEGKHGKEWRPGEEECRVGMWKEGVEA